MAGLRPPERDIGAARAPLWTGRALLGFFVLFLLVMALLERLGLASMATAQAVVTAALALFAGIALLSPARRAADYHVADRDIPPRRAGVAAAGTLAGILSVGAVGGMFAGGADLLIAAAGLLVGCLLLGIVFAPRLRRFGGHTIGDFLHARFGLPSRLVAAAIAFISSFLVLTGALSASAPLLANFVGMTPRQGLIATAGLTALAVLPGGMRSLTASHGLQYVVAVLGCLTPVVFVAWGTGALPLPAPAAPEVDWRRAATSARIGLLVAVALPVLFTAAQAATLPQLLVHGATARSERAATAAFAWAIIFSLILLVSALLFGRAALEAAGAPADAITGELLLLSGPPLAAFPPMLAGLAMAALLAMLLAVGQAALFSAALTLSHDVWDTAIRPRDAPSGRVFVARLLAIGLAAMAAWLASSAAPYAGVLLGWALALAAAGNFAPLLLGLWWSRCNATGAIAGASAGAAAIALSLALDPVASEAPANAALLGVVTAFAATVIGSLVTAPPPASQAGLVRQLRRGASRQPVTKLSIA